MQGHMFWALFIHAQDAQDVRDDPGKVADVWEDLKNLRQLFRATPWQRGQTALRHVPPLEDTLIDYYTRGAYDEYWSRIEHDYTRFWDQHADIPGTFSTGWYDPFPAADSEYFAAMAAKNDAPQRLVIGPWSHVGMRGDATFCHDVDFGPQSTWGVQRYFEEQLEFFERWLPDNATGQPEGEAPVRIFVMGGGERPQDGGGEARPRRPLARRVGVAARPGRCRRRTTSTADGSLSTDRLPPRRAAAIHVRPGASGADDRRPLLLDRRAAGGGCRHGAGLGALPQPRAAAARPAHAGPGRPEGVAGVLRLGGALPAALRAARRARLPKRSP